MIQSRSLILFVASLSGCMLGPDYQRPEIETPEQFQQRVSEGASIANLKWWELFRDQELQRLIVVALEQNKDLAIATARVEETRARLGFVRADQFPRVDGVLDINRGNTAEQFIPDAGVQNSYLVSAQLTFEVDLFGKLRRQTESARQELLASEEARRTVLTALISDVASTYFLLRDLDQRRDIAARTLASRRESTRIVRERFNKGTIPKIDVNQAEIQEADAAAALARLERQVIETENLLNVLLGRNPGKIARGEAIGSQLIPPRVPTGLPSELLERRPDIRTAERQLAAQTERIGIAEALRFPSLALTADAGVASNELNDLADSNANIWNIGANFFAPLYNAGQNKRRVEIEIARTEQLISEYEFTVLQALREVEDALAGVRTLRSELAARRAQREAARSAAFLSKARYDGGVTSYLEVLIANDSLFQAENAVVAVERARLVAIVDLYKALGGGWSVQPTAGASSAEAGDSAQ
ncbi:MAG: efflux transporter outer membrane subunit [Betaproteobacteria bacterium]|nr:MAG: efflux transporter outer membrane subunit [Betaproteobacteria bacterium]